MMTGNVSTLILAFLAGIGTGAVFYGGLWWTITKGATVRQPALLFLTSFFVRMAAVVTAIYLISGACLDRLAVCMLGLLIAKAVVARRVRPQEAHLQEKAHAPQSR